MGENLSRGLGQISESLGGVSRMFQTAQLTKGLEGGPYYDPDMARLAYEQKRMTLNDLLINAKTSELLASAGLKTAKAQKGGGRVGGGGGGVNLVGTTILQDPSTGESYSVGTDKRSGKVITNKINLPTGVTRVPGKQDPLSNLLSSSGASLGSAPAAPPSLPPVAAPKIPSVDNSQIINDAQSAISRGADPLKVKARLQQMGIQLP